MYYIYVLKDKFQAVRYVGQTQNLDDRARSHRKRQPEEHIFCPLLGLDDAIEAKNMEIELIDWYDTYEDEEGWNKSPGGEGFEGYSRKGIGGAPKGRVPWNRGKQGCFSDATIERFSQTRQGKRWSSKLNEQQVVKIIKDFAGFDYNERLVSVSRNGRRMSKIWAFSKANAKQYQVTPACIKRLLLGETWQDVD